MRPERRLRRSPLAAILRAATRRLRCRSRPAWRGRPSGPQCPSTLSTCAAFMPPRSGAWRSATFRDRSYLVARNRRAGGARLRLCPAVSRPVPGRGDADARLHAGRAGRGALAAAWFRCRIVDGARRADLLPLPDGSIDRVLLVHLLEVTEHPRDVLDEVWRVLTPGGRMIVVAPNRRGLWARRHDAVRLRPALLEGPVDACAARNPVLARTLRRDPLRAPVTTARSLLRLAPPVRGIGAAWACRALGLHVVEATKQLYRPVLLRKPVRRALPPVSSRRWRRPAFRRRRPSGTRP